MGSFGSDAWLCCSWCDTPETISHHTDVDGIGFLCVGCLYYGPPHFEYLRDLLGPCFLSETTAKSMTVDHIIIKIAAFAYKPCEISEAEALQYGIYERHANDSEYEYECDVCNESWKGWTCQYCSKKHRR